MEKEILRFDAMGIQECQRNRYPLLFIDRVEEAVPLERAHAIKNFSYNEWFFPAHFDDEPNVPGFVQVEALAQTFLMTFLCVKEYRGMKTAFVSIDKTKFKRKLIPGDRLDIYATFDGCDAVIHLASSKDAINVEGYISNIQVGSSVLQACKELNITNIINVSSRAVWQNHIFANKSQDEESIPQPENLYGLGKLCVDTIADFYNQKYGMYIKTYRMGEICGLDLNKGMEHVFWRNMLLRSIEGKELPVYGTGMGGRDLIYVKDVTRALIAGIEAEKAYGIFNIGQGTIVTNLEIANVFCEVFSNQAGIKLYPQEENGGTEWNLDTEKAKRNLGFETRYAIKDIIKDIKKEYEASNNGGGI